MTKARFCTFVTLENGQPQARVEVSSEAHGMRNDPVTWRPVVVELNE